MTLRYRLFGIPRTFNEFVDKAKKEGEHKVNIAVGKYNSYPTPFNIVPWNHSVAIGLETGKIRTKLKTYTYNTHRGRKDLFDTVIGKAKVEEATLKEAIEIAEKLQEIGLEPTINKGNIEEATNSLTAYNEGIEKMVKEFS